MRQVSSQYAPPEVNLISATSLSPLSEQEFRGELAKIWQADTGKWDSLARYEIKESLPFHGSGKALTSDLQVSESLFVVGDHKYLPSQQGAMKSGADAARLINQLMR